MAWISVQRVLVLYGMHPPGAAFLWQRSLFEWHVQRGKGFEMLPLRFTAPCFSTSVRLAPLAESLKNVWSSEDNKGREDTSHCTA